MRLTRFGEGQSFGWLSMSQAKNLMARPMLVVLCALVAAAVALGTGLSVTIFVCAAVLVVGGAAVCGARGAPCRACKDIRAPTMCATSHERRDERQSDADVCEFRRPVTSPWSSLGTPH